MNNNNNLKVKVDLGVEINKARVELTTEQRSEVSKFVTTLLFGKGVADSLNTEKTRTTKVPKKYHRVFGKRSWTRDEEVRFMELARQYGPEVQNQSQFFRAIGREMGRTPSSLLNRLHAIRRGKGELSPSDVPNSVIPSERGWRRREVGEVSEGPNNVGPMSA